jgi:hypothetical protein
VPTTQTSGEDASEEMHLSVEPQSASMSSLRTLEEVAFMDFGTSDMAVKDLDVENTPEDELRHQWKDETEQGFWPEVMECQRCEGCICWRCASGRKLELPNAIMAPIYERDWNRLMISMGHDRVARVGNWDDSAGATEAEETQVYNESDFAHLYVWCKEAGVAILTVHPDIGLAHRHMEVEPCIRGTKKDIRDIYTGYFMCLAPKDEDGEEVEDQNEHAIEAISITWEKGEEKIAQAPVLDPKRKKPPCSSVSHGSRAAHLFNVNVSRGKASPTEHLYNMSHDQAPFTVR